MKEMNLETQLRSWEPRRPSAGIKRRLWPESRVEPELGRLVRWLAPAVACGLLALAAFQSDEAFQAGHAGGQTSAPLGRSGDFAMNGVTINRLPTFFEWTNQSGSALTIRSFLPGTTN
jgi:hypothetical protein